MSRAALRTVGTYAPMGRALAAVILAAGAAGAAAAPPLTIVPRGGIDLTAASATDQTGTPFVIAGLSGITRLPDGRFAAVMDNSDKVVLLTVALSANGTPTGATVVGGLRLAAVFDHEDVAWSGAGLDAWIAEENTPAVRRYNLADGAAGGPLPTPSVFLTRRDNFGFEALTRDPLGRAIWTANEEALTPDGPVSTAGAGTTVRLQRYQPDGAGGAAPAQQFAYRTAPLHGSAVSGSRSGLAALVALPDGRLLAVERSLAFSLSGLFQTRIYAVGFAGATDVSAVAALSGASFTPVSRESLYAGSLNNLEGLCLGPRLGAGRYALVGVVDDGDPVSVNRVVVFEVSGVVEPPCAADVASAGGAPEPDGFVTGEDFDLFVQSFFDERRAPAGWLVADVADGVGGDRPDGFITGADFDRFVDLFFSGC
ncbi:MAG: esterase-like activity of phytase family protein [Phycisphaerae bacterium]|nr:esterase-like activity of phytase family protein [Phycisphaerae bacterium]